MQVEAGRNWHTPETGGKVDRGNPTQSVRAMRQLGVEMIPAYSPEARGRCERMFNIHQERLPRELSAHVSAKGMSSKSWRAICSRKAACMPGRRNEAIRSARGWDIPFVSVIDSTPVL